MGFLLAANESANLVFTNNIVGGHSASLKLTISPAQDIPGFPLNKTGDEFPLVFTNTGSFKQSFDIDAFYYLPPPWNPTGWMKYTDKSFTTVSANSYRFAWLDASNGKELYVMTVTVGV